MGRGKRPRRRSRTGRGRRTGRRIRTGRERRMDKGDWEMHGEGEEREGKEKEGDEENEIRKYKR